MPFTTSLSISSHVTVIDADVTSSVLNLRGGPSGAE